MHRVILSSAQTYRSRRVQERTRALDLLELRARCIDYKITSIMVMIWVELEYWMKRPIVNDLSALELVEIPRYLRYVPREVPSR